LGNTIAFVAKTGAAGGYPDKMGASSRAFNAVVVGIFISAVVALISGKA